MERTTDAISAAIAGASTRYTRLVLLVGPGGVGKSSLLRQLAASSGVPVVNVGCELTPSLAETPLRRRSVAAADAFGDLVRGSVPESLRLLDNLEVLFLPDLRLDPLKLLQDASRNRVVVAAWPGNVDSGDLRYADPSHPEFRTYHAPDCLLVEVASLPRGPA